MRSSLVVAEQSLKKLLRDAYDYLYLSRYRKPDARAVERAHSFDRIHYGCGAVLLPGWLNVDMIPDFRVPAEQRDRYLQMSLIHPHPFGSNTFQFGFAEDFLEHLTQDESLLFLAEAYRTLRPGGTLRLSFPNLKNVLKTHYRSSDFAGADTGRREAFTPYKHKHFYCEESIDLVARHLGFREVEFAKFSQSRHAALAALDTRSEQADLNLIVDLTK